MKKQSSILNMCLAMGRREKQEDGNYIRNVSNHVEKKETERWRANLNDEQRRHQRRVTLTAAMAAILHVSISCMYPYPVDLQKESSVNKQ